jgi:hypothetical protein
MQRVVGLKKTLKNKETKLIMANTIDNKWWKRLTQKMNKFASYFVTLPARERYMLQESLAENEMNGTTKTNKVGED